MNSYSLMKAIGDIDDKYVMEALNDRGKVKLGATQKLILVAVLIFLLAATALAVYHSPLLSMLFSRTEGEPTKAAEEHLVQPDATSQPKPQMAACDFHIDEYLLDGDHLYVSYSLQNPTEEPLIYEVSLRANGRALGGNEENPPVLGGTLDDVSLPATIQKQLELDLEETAGDTLDATLSIFVLRPMAGIIRMDESSPVGTPVIVFDARRKRVVDYSNGWTYTASDNGWFSDENSTGSGGSMASNHDDLFSLKAQIEASDDIRLSHFQALEKLGYVQIVERQNIPLRFENGAVQARVDPDLCLDAGIGELEIHSLTVGAVQTRLTAVLRPYEAWKHFMNDDEHIVEAWVYLSGESEPVTAGRGNALVDCDFDFDVADPDAYRFELEWISQNTPIQGIRIEFVDYYEAPGKHLGSVEWKVD